MPVYTYRCENCGVQFDQTQKFSDSPLTRCPECNHKSLRKVYLPVGIVFKGKGFYATDNRSPSGQKWSSSHEDKTSAHSTDTHTEKAAESAPKPESAPAAPKSDKADWTNLLKNHSPSDTRRGVFDRFWQLQCLQIDRRTRKWSNKKCLNLTNQKEFVASRAR